MTRVTVLAAVFVLVMLAGVGGFLTGRRTADGDDAVQPFCTDLRDFLTVVTDVPQFIPEGASLEDLERVSLITRNYAEAWRALC